MRVSSAIVLAVVAALVSSTSAKPAAVPDTAGADGCPVFCLFDAQCAKCTGHTHCVSIGSFPASLCDNMAYLHGRSVFSAQCVLFLFSHRTVGTDVRVISDF